MINSSQPKPHNIKWLEAERELAIKGFPVQSRPTPAAKPIKLPSTHKEGVRSGNRAGSMPSPSSEI